MVRCVLFIILLPAIAVSLLAIESLGSLRNQHFYKDRIRDTDVYEFISRSVPASLVEEARDSGLMDLAPPVEENLFDVTGLTPADLADSAGVVIPEEWLRTTLESRLERPVDWLAGRSDRFSINVAIDDRVPILTAEAEVLLRKVETEKLVSELLLNPALDRIDRTRADLGAELDRGSVTKTVTSVFPEEWIEDQALTALEEITPYLRGQTDTFTVRVELEERTDVAAESLATALLESGWYDDFLEDLIVQSITEELSTSLPESDVQIPELDVSGALELSPVLQTLHSQTEDAIRELLLYLTGQSNEPHVSVDLRELKSVVLPQLMGPAADAYRTIVSAVPDCGPDVVMVNFSGVPPCIPAVDPGRTTVLEQIDAYADDIESTVEDIVVTSVPDVFHLTEDDLATQLERRFGSGVKELVYVLRALLTDGWVYTDEDLRADLGVLGGEQAVAELDQARQTIRNGVVFTDEDLIAALHPAVAALLGQGRTALKLAPWLVVPMSALALVIAILIGATARDSLRTKVVWAAGSVAIGSLIFAAVVGPGFSIAEPVFYSYLLGEVVPPGLEHSDFPRTIQSVSEKGVELATNVTRGYLHGAAMKALIAAFVALTVSGCAVFWDRFKAKPPTVGGRPVS